MLSIIFSILLIIWVPIAFIFGIILLGYGLMSTGLLIEGIDESFTEDCFTYRLEGVGKFGLGLSFLLFCTFYGSVLIMFSVLAPLKVTGVITDITNFVENVYPTAFLNVACWFIMGITCLIVFVKLIMVLYNRELLYFITDEMLPAVPMYLVIFAIFFIIKLYFMTPIVMIGLTVFAVIYLIICHFLDII